MGNFAICSYGKGGCYNYGTKGKADNGTYNYGIYGEAAVVTNSYAGYFNGNVRVTGTFQNPSDIKLKENIKSISPVLVNLMKLKPLIYNFKKDAPEFKSMGLASGRHYGFTAQELEEVFPELVSTEAHPPEDEKGEPLIFKSINYIEMIPILVKAIQEQQEEIENLKKELVK